MAEFLTHSPDNISVTLQHLNFVSSDRQISVKRANGGRSHELERRVYSMDQKTKRYFFGGNEHEDIAYFIPILLARQPITIPLTIVNFDYHIDDSRYYNIVHLNAGWQRYEVDQRETTYFTSYNVQPFPEVVQDSSFTQMMTVEEYLDSMPPGIDIVSVDFDVFNDDRPSSPRGKLLMDAIHKSIARSHSVMTFLSPIFSTHKEEQSIVRDLFRTTIKSAQMQ